MIKHRSICTTSRTFLRKTCTSWIQTWPALSINIPSETGRWLKRAKKKGWSSRSPCQTHHQSPQGEFFSLIHSIYVLSEYVGNFLGHEKITCLGFLRYRFIKKGNNSISNLFLDMKVELFPFTNREIKIKYLPATYNWYFKILGLRIKRLNIFLPY